MRLLWLCNTAPGRVKAALGQGGDGGGLWMDHVLSGLEGRELTLRVLCRGASEASGELDGWMSYSLFREPLPHRYQPELERMFGEELDRFRPDVIHIWGTEYGHTLAMVNAAEDRNLLDRVAVGIQGLCSVIAKHYCEGIPHADQRSCTLRDFLRQDNTLQQQGTFRRRGELEISALEKARHVMGRTRWDFACTREINPGRNYHFCNETLREPFYEGSWQYDSCRKHRIFASSCEYPVKGFHYLLEAFGRILKDYPDATLAVPGESFLTASPLRRTAYQRYLARLAVQYGAADKIDFLGSLTGEQMKKAYLEANVFCLPSTIENSPNSLGEAMLLGLPCVASDVGGVTDLLVHNAEGYVYPSTEPALLAHYIREVFSQEEKAGELGRKAQAHARVTHDPQTNLETLLNIYAALGGGERSAP